MEDMGLYQPLLQYLYMYTVYVHIQISCRPFLERPRLKILRRVIISDERRGTEILIVTCDRVCPDRFGVLTLLMFGTTFETQSHLHSSYYDMSLRSDDELNHNSLFDMHTR